MRYRGLILASLFGFPAGFVTGFCAAPVLYLLTYKDQWSNLWTIGATVGVLGLLVAGVLAAAARLQDVRIVWARRRPVATAQTLQPEMVFKRAL